MDKLEQHQKKLYLMDGMIIPLTDEQVERGIKLGFKIKQVDLNEILI